MPPPKMAYSISSRLGDRSPGPLAGRSARPLGRGFVRRGTSLGRRRLEERDACWM